MAGALVLAASQAVSASRGSRAAARVRAAADEMSQLQQREDTLIVAHQGVLSLLLATWLGMPVAAMWHFPFSHDAYTVVENRAGHWVLRVFNGRNVWQTEE